MLWHVVKVDRPDWDNPMLAASLECDILLGGQL